VAKAKRFAGHVEDLVASITEFPQHVREIGGEYGQAIHDHAAMIIGVTAGYLMAEAASLALAMTPGGQLPAAMIQLALAAFGAQGMATAVVQAVEHASRWMSLAWTANGKEDVIAAASKEFIKMLVSVLMAALAFAGIKDNIGKATALAADAMPAVVPAAAIRLWNMDVRDGELVCGAMQLDLANGQQIFIDPTYHFGMRVGGSEQRAIWLENQTSSPAERIIQLASERS